MFEVYDVSNAFTRGWLEVTHEDIIYTSSNTIRWPLKYIRSYGAREEVFYIEIGRQCASGEGVYGFKSAQASEIEYAVRIQCQLAYCQVKRGLPHRKTYSPGTSSKEV